MSSPQIPKLGSHDSYLTSSWKDLCEIRFGRLGKYSSSAPPPRAGARLCPAGTRITVSNLLSLLIHRSGGRCYLGRQHLAAHTCVHSGPVSIPKSWGISEQMSQPLCSLTIKLEMLDKHIPLVTSDMAKMIYCGLRQK